MNIKCSFCDAEYDPAEGHTCAGNSVTPPYKRTGGVEPSAPWPRVDPPLRAHTFAKDLLHVELTKLQDERAAIDQDYEAYRLVHEPMIASLLDALSKL